jgi:hypothetical protein
VHVPYQGGAKTRPVCGSYHLLDRGTDRSVPQVQAAVFRCRDRHTTRRVAANVLRWLKRAFLDMSSWAGSASPTGGHTEARRRQATGNRRHSRDGEAQWFAAAGADPGADP